MTQLQKLALKQCFDCVDLLLTHSLTRSELVGERHEYLVFADRMIESYKHGPDEIIKVLKTLQNICYKSFRLSKQVLEWENTELISKLCQLALQAETD